MGLGSSQLGHVCALRVDWSWHLAIWQAGRRDAPPQRPGDVHPAGAGPLFPACLAGGLVRRLAPWFPRARGLVGRGSGLYSWGLRQADPGTASRKLLGSHAARRRVHPPLQRPAVGRQSRHRGGVGYRKTGLILMGCKAVCTTAALGWQSHPTAMPAAMGCRHACVCHICVCGRGESPTGCAERAWWVTGKQVTHSFRQSAWGQPRGTRGGVQQQMGCGKWAGLRRGCLRQAVLR